MVPIVFCLAFIGGIAVGSWLNFSSTLVILILALILIILLLLFSFHLLNKLLCQGSFFILGLCLGLLLINHATAYLQRIDQFGSRSNIQLRARVISEKETREKYSRFIVKPVNFLVKGKVLLLASKNDSYAYGDILSLKGKLEIPQTKANFDYQKYLAKDGIYWIMPFPRVQLINKADSSFINIFYQELYRIRSHIRRAIMKSFSGRNANFLRAVLLGDRGVINKEFRQQLSRSGTAHIVAISGLHLSILALFLFNLFLFLGLWRKQATNLTIICLVIFLVFIGFRASLVRAVLMTSLALVAYASGKLIEGERILLYIATLMLILNPLLLRYDVGFQLSFLAVFGILSFYPAFSYLLQKIRMPRMISDLVSATLAAQIFTAPTVAINFQIVSFLAPLANFIVLSLLPFILAFAFLWEILATIHPLLLLNLILFSLLDSLVKFIQWIAHFPFAAISVQYPDIFLPFGAIYYVFLITLVILWKRFYQHHLTPLAQYLKWREE